MNYEWIGNTIKKKNPIKKIENLVKTKVKLPHVNKKSLARKRMFVHTTFSHSTLKTYPADCRKIAAVDSNKHDWD